MQNMIPTECLSQAQSGFLIHTRVNLSIPRSALDPLFNFERRYSFDDSPRASKKSNQARSNLSDSEAVREAPRMGRLRSKTFRVRSGRRSVRLAKFRSRWQEEPDEFYIDELARSRRGEKRDGGTSSLFPLSLSRSAGRQKCWAGKGDPS